MRIVFTARPKAKAALVALLEARADYATDALLQAQIFIEDVEQQLIETGEPPSQADVIWSSEAGFWWLYIKGIWLGFRTVDSHYGMLRRAMRTVTLYSAAELPPRV